MLEKEFVMKVKGPSGFGIMKHNTWAPVQNKILNFKLFQFKTWKNYISAEP